MGRIIGMLEIIILGIIHGITEFLPISSSGHLVIAQIILGIKSPGNTLEVLFHFGTLMSVFHIFFQTNFDNPFNLYANHAHSDIIEFIGEFGLIGFILIMSSFLSFFLKKRIFNLNYFVLYILSLTILTFDFSLHVPLIQLLFVIYFVSAKKITQLS